MKKLLSALSVLALALPASATPQSPDYINGGQCAGDVYSKCRYSLEIVNPNEVMVTVPNLEYLGPSRLSTVEHCAELTQTQDWRSMVTDEDLVLMDDCLQQHT